MKKVLIPTKLDKVAREILTASGNYEVVQEESEDLEGLARRHPDAYALIVRSNKVTPEIIDMLPKLKVIVRAGAGYNTIDTKYARQKGVDVMNTPGANANAVAEEVIALMLADARHIVRGDPSVRSGRWEKKQFMGREVSHKTVGIIGLGQIGQLTAKRLSGFDCRLLGYDPVISSQRAEELNVELVDVETIFSESDYVTLHIPETDETRNMVNEKLLSRMKHGATLINTSRAGVVDEEAIAEAKKTKNIRFLNDVYSRDAEGEKSVATIADVMLPHLGASTQEANFNAAKRAAEELIDLDEKGVTSYIVNRAIPEGLDEAYCELSNTLARLCRAMVGRNATPKTIETSFYGSLAPFADWLLVPIVAGIWDDVDRSLDFRAARSYLKEMGISYVDRDVDNQKGYGNSITVDMTADTGRGGLRNVSIRGTIAEGITMVSRINEFQKLYFEPLGPTAFFLYDDRPGVLGKIASKLAENGINIEDVRNPHDPKTNRSLAILKVNQAVSADLASEIGKAIDAHTAVSIVL